MRTIVVGASSGLGRCLGPGLAHRGSSVALLARRLDRLESAVTEAGEGATAHAIQCDVTDEASVDRAIAAAAEALGGIDAVVYTPGVGPLVRIEDTDAATWRNVFDTNVIGASLVTRAALPHLVESKGAVIYLSSVSASQTPPWPGLASYVVSKAALEKLVDAWRTEHPAVGFTRLSVGECAGGDGEAMTEFANTWDGDLAVELAPVWIARAYMTGELMDVEKLIDIVDALLRSGAGLSIPSITVNPRHTAAAV